MKTSPLQLDSYFLLKTEVSLIENRDNSGGSQDVNISVAVVRARHEEDPRKWKIDLDVKVTDSDEHPSPYSVEVKLRGFFTVADDFPEERIEILVAANAPAVLYGSVREIVTLLTSRGPSYTIILPSMTFIDDAKKIEAAALQAKEALAQKSPIEDQT